MKRTFLRSKPVVAFTSGDPSGIGPEIVGRAWPVLARFCRPLLVGEAAVWRRAGLGGRASHNTGLGGTPPPLGRPGAAGGRMSFAAVEAAVRLAARGLVDAVVTAPISKEAWRLAGIPFPDHTEYLRAATGCDGQMILAAPERGLWCVLATRHIPHARVSRRLSPRTILAAATALDQALRRLGRNRPRLLLCGLNPHAGEGGLLGGEEARLLAPAMALARRSGLALRGPVPADAAWLLHARGSCDGLVCLYHDQALIGLKAAAGLSLVNWTAGLPFIRVSPGHGTAFGLAGRGAADVSGIVAAARLAARLAFGPLGAASAV